MLLLVLLVLPQAVDVDAAGCVEAAAVVDAINGVGGIDDVAERVSVVVVDGHVVVDVLLVGAPPLHREAPLRPVECADVADLAAFLVKSQREQAQAARSVTSSSSLPAPEPPTERALQRSPARVDNRRVVDTWSLCDGPPSCGGLRTTGSFGVGFPIGPRVALDVGLDLDEHLTPLVGVELAQRGRVLVSGGLQWRDRVADDVVELSARATVGVGGGLDDYGEHRGATWTVAPEIVGRGRVGFLFLDVGVAWHLNLDPIPGAFVALGFAFSGP